MKSPRVVFNPALLDDFVETLDETELAAHESRYVGNGDIAYLRRRTMQAFNTSLAGLLGHCRTREDHQRLGEWLDAAREYRLICYAEAGYADACYHRIHSAYCHAEQQLRGEWRREGTGRRRRRAED